MTGYGIDYAVLGGLKVSCWIKSVNSRFLDIFFDIPPEHIGLEPDMSREIRKRVRRGRVEVFIRKERSRFVLPLKKERSEEVFRVFLSALLKFEESRKREGEIIAQDLLQRIGKIREIVDDISSFHSTFPERIRAMLRERINQLSVELKVDDIPDDMIDKAGVVHIVRKADIAEEIVRIKAHVDAFEEELEGEGDGKKLSFIAQELLREFNTLGMKSHDVRISEKVIEAKLEIERIREQLHNVE